MSLQPKHLLHIYVPFVCRTEACHRHPFGLFHCQFFEVFDPTFRWSPVEILRGFRGGSIAVVGGLEAQQLHDLPLHGR